MPKCIINQCTNRTGSKDQSKEIILHRFPNDIIRIRQWLTSTGQQFSNVDELAKRIFDENKNKKYRLCSEHFSQDSYIVNATSRILRQQALPTIFPTVEEGEILIDEIQKTTTKRKRITEISNATTMPDQEYFEEQTERSNNQSTQTDFTLWNSNITYKNESELYCTSQLESTNVPPRHSSSRILLSTPNPKETESPLKKKPHICRLQYHEIPIETTDFFADIEPLSPIMEHAPILESRTDASFQFEEEMEKLQYSFEESQIRNDPKDKDYVPDEETLDDSTISALPSFGLENPPPAFNDIPLTEEEQVKNRKFIIFESCLDQLLLKVRCLKSPDCSSTVKSFQKILDGTYCKIKGKCYNGHSFTIAETQPKIGRYSSGNLQLASAILFSGLNFQKIKEFLDIFGLQNISEKTYYRYQSLFLLPAIDVAWKKEKQQLLSQFHGKNICISGDGQCDSPGHSAKYCVYTVMESVTEKILDFEVVQKSQCSSSVAMEKFGFTEIMDRIINSGFKVKVFASDRHVSIRKKMKDDYPRIRHQFDVWHYAKSIRKKLNKASQGTYNKQIVPWIEKLNLHFWWCIKTCDNNVDLLREKWLSLLYHITNVHSFEGEFYTHCAHGPLEIEDDDERKILWLKPETPPYKSIAKIINNKQLMDDMPNLVHNCHTGALECFHGMALKYRTKRIHFGVDAMEARTKLAALTHNYNTGRQQATVKVQRKNTEELGTQRTKLIVPKGKKRWIVRNVYQKMSVEYLEDLMVTVLKLCNGELSHTWQSRAPTLPPNLANLERPSKEAVKLLRIARFRTNEKENMVHLEVDLCETNLFE